MNGFGHPVASRRGRRASGAAAVLLTALGLGTALDAVPAAADDTIYRTVDEKGHVVFTDVPPRNGEQSTPVKLDRPNSFTPPPQQPSATTVDQWLAQQQGGDGKAAAPGYQSLRIVAPEPDASIRENAGNVVVTGESQPPLRAGDTVQVYLDGALRQSAPATTVQLANVDRGTHSVQLRIVDAAGKTLATSEPVTFHLHRRSVILQPAPGTATKPAPKPASKQ